MNISIEFVIHVQGDSFQQVRETHMQNLQMSRVNRNGRIDCKRGIKKVEQIR